MEKIIGIRNDKTIFKDGACVVKTFHKNYTKAQVLNEALNHARVEETELCVPKLLSVTEQNGQWVMVYAYVQGQTLEHIMQKNSDRFDHYLEIFVNLQLEVHRQNIMHLRKQKDRLIEKIEKTDLLATTRYELQRKLDMMRVHKKLCHGDFNPSNIIIDQDGRYYIIDWAHATIGNASGDASATYLDFLINDNQKNADKYLDLYCQKTKTSKTYVKAWLPIVAAARLLKAKKNEKDKLLEIINQRNDI